MAADAKTRPHDGDVDAFLATVTHTVRRRDADTLLALMQRVTGEPPVMWGPSIVGFGSYHYRYASGREGDAAAAGFSPRKAASTVYLPDGIGAHEDLLARLGPHTASLVCLYLKDLSTNDPGVLEEIVRRSYAAVTAGTFTQRARES